MRHGTHGAEPAPRPTFATVRRSLIPSAVVTVTALAVIGAAAFGLVLRHKAPSEHASAQLSPSADSIA
jgi:hypothetical protein